MTFISDYLKPTAPMRRIIFHWTGGSYTPSSLDKEHYHFVIDGNGRVHAGLHKIDANIPPLREGEYAAHTRATNSYSIGIALCCMAGATEGRSNGKYPVKEKQFERLAEVIAELCRTYNIPVTPETVLSHAEVQETLGIKQNGKWDISVLPFDTSTKGARAVGDRLRARVKRLL